MYSDSNHISVVLIVYFIVIVAESFTVVLLKFVYFTGVNVNNMKPLNTFFPQTIITLEKIRSHPQICVNRGYVF